MTITEAPTISTDRVAVEALFKEARLRRRRRWIATGLAAVVLIGAVIIAAPSGGPPSHPTAKPTTPATGNGGPSTLRRVEAKYGGALVMQMGLLGDTSPTAPHAGWTVNGLGIYVTSDDGAQWRNVTPSLIADQEPGDRVGAMIGFGSEDLWLPVVDVIDLVPFSQSLDGSDRGEGIERSNNGGQTWQFSSLPGCLQTCGGSLQLSFVDPLHGFAATGPTDAGGVTFFSTDDGGATWKPIGTTLLTDEPLGMLFTSLSQGWLLSGPTFGSDGKATDSGRVLYSTIDGGVTWTRARGLPTNDLYDVPAFFGPSVGVVLAQPNGPSASGQLAIYRTENGGATWTKYPTPVGAALSKPSASDTLSLPFSASSPADWQLFPGRSLYTTTNSGRTWTKVIPVPHSFPTAVSSIQFGSAKYGWAEALVPNCPSESISSCSQFQIPILASTNDGGKVWKVLDYFNPEASAPSESS